MNEQTDLEAFVALYKRFGIECKIIPPDQLSDCQTIQFCDYGWDNTVTTDERFDGYTGFSSMISFDLSGKFVGQGFYE